MSGALGNSWSMTDNHLDLAFQIAKELNETIDSYDELVAFLKTAPANELHRFSFVPSDNDVTAIRVGPVIESKDAERPFLVAFPDKLYKSSKIDVNVLFTVTSNVSSFCYESTSDSKFEI